MRRDLSRQRWQFLAVVVTIVLGVMLFAASWDAFSNLSASYERTYDRLAFADITAGGGDQAAIAQQVGATPGVEAVETRTEADVPFELGPGTKLIGRVVSMPTEQQPSVNKVDVIEGSYLNPDRPTGVLVETHMAEHFSLVPGSRFLVTLAGGPTEVEMIGEAVSAEYIFPARSRQDLITTPDDFGVVFASEELVGRTPAAAQVAQTAAVYGPGVDGDQLDRAITEIATGLGASDTTTRDEQPSNAALSEDLQGFSELSLMFPLLFLTAAGLATFIILNRIVHSQRVEIGTLAANGFGRGRILRHYMAYGIVIGVSGALVGLAVGIPLGGLITSAYTGVLNIPDTVTELHWTTPIAGVVFGLAMGTFSALAPALGATRLAPAEAMRGDAPSGGGASIFEKLLPPLRGLHVRWRLALRGIGRAKRRSLSTVVGVALAIVLILASWGMIDTVELLMARQFDDITHNDAQVFMREPVDGSTIERLESVEGVATAEAVLTLDASIGSGSEQYTTQLQGFGADTVMHSFLTGDGEIDLPPSGVLLGTALAGLLDLAPGDPVAISVPSLGTAIDTEVVDFVDEPLGTYAYMERGALASALGAASPPISSQELESPLVTSTMVTYEDGVDGEVVRDRLSGSGGVAAVVASTTIRDLLDEVLALFYAFVGVMLVFGGIMAFALMFNAISVNIAERSGELANMRANGVSVRQVNAMMTVENLLLTLVGIPVGLAAGYVVAAEFMGSFSSDLFQFDLTMRPRTFVLTAVAMLAVTLISQWPGSRVVRRLDIAKVVRERSQ